MNPSKTAIVNPSKINETLNPNQSVSIAEGISMELRGNDELEIVPGELLEALEVHNKQFDSCKPAEFNGTVKIVSPKIVNPNPSYNSGTDQQVQLQGVDDQF